MTDDEFTKLSKPEQQVAIARDVMRHLNSGHFIARHEKYMHTDGGGPDGPVIVTDTQVQTVLRARKCRLCALGGIFAATVERYNELTMGEMNFDLGDSAMQLNYLRPYFDESQLRLIETAFEGRVVRVPGSFELAERYSELSIHDLRKMMADDADTRAYPTSERTWLRAALTACEQWKPKFHDAPGALMRAIMLNIIYNSGRFYPQQPPLSTDRIIAEALTLTEDTP